MESKNLDQKLRKAFLKFNVSPKYGTSGFRTVAEHMPYIVYRVGAFVAILNQTLPNLSLGVVITASHNPIQDNGVKITNFNGNVLEVKYETLLEQFVAQNTLQIAVTQFKKYLESNGQICKPVPVQVLTGGDTRPSTAHLLAILKAGIESQNGKAICFNQTTTPQLQYYVYLRNKYNSGDQNIEAEVMRPLYWNNFCKYFFNCAQYLKWKNPKQRTIDCANGVGGIVLPEFTKIIRDYLDVSIINKEDTEYLNRECGADFIKVNKKFPRQYSKNAHNSFVTFDGDADRIIMFVDQGEQLQIIDGDRQGTLFTQFFQKLSNQLNSKLAQVSTQSTIFTDIPTSPTIGLVQTYYANYASSCYLRDKYKMDPVYAATGVKNLHHKAEYYDIGIYFEGNGHGTVIFNPSFIQKFETFISHKDKFEKETQNNQKIRQCIQLIQFFYNVCQLANPTVGDAISMFMLFEIALEYLGMDYMQTLKMYTDIKSKTSKIKVSHKEIVKVTEIEDKVIFPEGLQSAIDKVLEEHQGKKAFLRPSGTEDLLRLHVEADTELQVDKITAQVTKIVQNTQILN